MGKLVPAGAGGQDELFQQRVETLAQSKANLVVVILVDSCCWRVQALAALHQDEDFQQDLLRLPIQRVIDDTKRNPENYEK